MNRRHPEIRSGLILALVAGLTGCQDPDIGTIKADRSVVQQLQRANSDRPSLPSKSSRKRPDLNDLSPKLGGSEARP